MCVCVLALHIQCVCAWARGRGDTVQQKKTQKNKSDGGQLGTTDINTKQEQKTITTAGKSSQLLVQCSTFYQEDQLE